MWHVTGWGFALFFRLQSPLLYVTCGKSQEEVKVCFCFFSKRQALKLFFFQWVSQPFTFVLCQTFTLSQVSPCNKFPWGQPAFESSGKWVPAIYQTSCWIKRLRIAILMWLADSENLNFDSQHILSRITQTPRCASRGNDIATLTQILLNALKGKKSFLLISLTVLLSDSWGFLTVFGWKSASHISFLI